MSHQPSAEEIYDQVKTYVLEEFLPGEDPDQLKATTPLISGGVLDSVGRLKLVSFLEESFGFLIEAHEVDVEHMETLALVVDLVQSKLANGGS